MHTLTRLASLALPLLFALPATAQYNGHLLLAPDLEPGDMLGAAVDHGTTIWSDAVVGAPGDDDRGAGSGSAMVFRTGGDRSWAPLEELTAPDGAAGDHFGAAVATDRWASEGWLAVGAPEDDDRGLDSGSVYVFADVDGAWRSLQKLTAPDGAAGDDFGAALDILRAEAGWTLLVGAPGAGAAYVYALDGGAWTLRAQLTEPDPTDGARFGAAVALSDERAAIGAPEARVLGASSGAAYVFRLEPGPVSSPAARLTPSAPADGQQFGFALDIDGDRVAVGVPGDDELGPETGAVHVFRDLGGYKREARILVDDPAAGDRLGHAVQLSGSGDFAALVATAPGRDVAGVGADAGEAWRWFVDTDTRPPTWEPIGHRTALDAQPGDRFGRALSGAGNQSLFGSAQGAVGLDSGAAYAMSVTFIGHSWPVCYGDGSGSPCGCGNAGDAVDGCRNSTGRGATLVAWTEPVTEAPAIGCWNLPSGELAFLVGSTGWSENGAPFGDGLDCLPGVETLHGFRTVDVHGHADWELDGPFSAPSFQVRYRDPNGPCGTGFNASNAWTF